MQQIVLTAAQRESLVKAIYLGIIYSDCLSLADIGTAETEAAQIVDQWAEDNNIIFE